MYNSFKEKVEDLCKEFEGINLVKLTLLTNGTTVNDDNYTIRIKNLKENLDDFKDTEEFDFFQKIIISRLKIYFSDKQILDMPLLVLTWPLLFDNVNVPGKVVMGIIAILEHCGERLPDCRDNDIINSFPARGYPIDILDVKDTTEFESKIFKYEEIY